MCPLHRDRMHVCMYMFSCITLLLHRARKSAACQIYFVAVLLADCRVRATTVTPITVLRDARYRLPALLVSVDRSPYFPRDFTTCSSQHESIATRPSMSELYFSPVHLGERERENLRQTRLANLVWSRTRCNLEARPARYPAILSSCGLLQHNKMITRSTHSDIGPFIAFSVSLRRFHSTWDKTARMRRHGSGMVAKGQTTWKRNKARYSPRTTRTDWEVTERPKEIERRIGRGWKGSERTGREMDEGVDDSGRGGSKLKLG